MSQPPPRVQHGLDLLDAIDADDDARAEAILKSPLSVDVNVQAHLEHGHYHPLLLAAVKHNLKILDLILKHPDCDPNILSGGPTHVER
jgi:hypothetical protein